MQLDNTPKFTYIIPYRHNAARILNLRRVLEWLGGFSGIEVLIVEQDSHSKISNLGLRASHIFIENPGPFNKNWSLNVGYKRAQTNLIVFGDSDLIMSPEHLIKSFDSLNEFEFVNPYQSVIDLSSSETHLNLGELLNINRPGRGETDHQKVPICGGITIFRKDALDRIGGWPEEFVGWGAEDDAMSIKVKNFLNWTQMPYKCYHLYHERNAPDMNLYQKNLNTLNKMSSLSKEDLHRMISNSAPKIGRMNLYS